MDGDANHVRPAASKERPEPGPRHEAPATNEAADVVAGGARTPDRHAVARRLGAGSERIVGELLERGEALAGTLRPAVDGVVERTERRLAQGRRRRRRHAPLPNLFEAHPEVRGAPLRELGLVSIPTDEIVGTAVEGPAQRGLDFKPLRPFRSSNWKGRWQRILEATKRLETLPPIDVLKTSDGYWVTDGHNRVAAALVTGQVEVDADVRRVVIPGEPVELPPGSLAPVLAGSDQVLAAGSGMLSRGATVGRIGPEPADPDDLGAQPGADARDAPR